MSFPGLVRALRAAKEEGGSLEGVPGIFWVRDTWGPEFFLELARFHWSAICFMPPDEITEEIARETVAQAPCSLKYVPWNLRTRELCMEATERDISVLDTVPSEFSEVILNKWLTQCPDTNDWNRIPSGYRTDDFTRRAIKANPQIIEAIPSKSHTQAMCDAFLQGGDHHYYLEDVIPDARSRILCIACLKENRGPLEAVPKNILGPDILEANNIGISLIDRTCDADSIGYQAIQ